MRDFKRPEISICPEGDNMGVCSICENLLSYTVIIVHYVCLNKKSKNEKKILVLTDTQGIENSKAQNVQTQKCSNSNCDCLSILNILISIFILCHLKSLTEKLRK